MWLLVPVAIGLEWYSITIGIRASKEGEDGEEFMAVIGITVGWCWPPVHIFGGIE